MKTPLPELDIKIRRFGRFMGIALGIGEILYFQLFFTFFTDAQAGLAILFSPIYALWCGASVGAISRGVYRYRVRTKPVPEMAQWAKVHRESMRLELILGFIGLASFSVVYYR
jgi:hypothetical protein